MDTDDGDPGKPSGLSELRDGEQPQDLLPGQPQAPEVELDSYGVPVQVRPANGREYLLAAGFLLCGSVSAGLGVMNAWAGLPRSLWVVCLLSGLVPALVGVRWQKEDKWLKLKTQVRWGKQLVWITRTGIVLGALSVFFLI